MNFEAIIIGCITGFLSAFFGIGGSSVDTPILRTFLDLPPLVALGTPLPLTVLTASIASFAYKREHLVNFRIALYSLLAGVPGMVLGSYLTAYLSGKFLMLLTAVVLCLVGVDFIIKNIMEKTFALEKTFSPPPVYYIVAVVAVIGILSGILANGGGIFLVPAYVIFFRMKIKEAIATSLLTVIVMALPGSIIHYHLGHINLTISASMAIGVIPMAYIGAKLDIRTSSKTVMLLYGIVMVVFSVYFFISQLKI
ncbi:MAG: sulfite exporter TauE/SafE family protein [Deltaproteobacteria bacterium]|nr:MAG: sulfite exporter TauE/SafE family protein [Deltaproteobacteria bacterium]